MKELSLLVAESIKGDVGRSLARIDIQQMHNLNLETGDVVEIEGGKKTGALIIPGRPQDRNKEVIRMDGLLRRNAQTSIGERVKIRKAKTAPAEHIVVAPVEEGISLRAPGKVVRQALRGKPVTKDDLVNISGPIRREPVSSSAGQGIDEFFSRFFGASPIALGEIGLVVISTKPNGLIIIDEQTRVDVLTEAPKHLQQISRITYEDIGGLDQVIQRVREMIELPMKHPELFQRLGIDPPKGVLLHGPPGTGKTLLAKAVANESGVNFVSLAGPEIMSKFYGESEQRVRGIFEDAEKHAPSIIFIDEIDSIAPKREEVTGEVERRVVAQLLSLMDGLKGRGRVIVIGATNRPNALDPALRRPGRFDREIETGVPDKSSRLEILMVHTRGMPLSDDVELTSLSDRTHGFVGADVAALTREAAMHTLRRLLPEIKFEEETLPPEILAKLVVTREDFEEALKSIDPSAMREVLIEIPNVFWEDVGGLDDVRQKLIEMIDWPIRRPDVFDKHGIDPPRGILLFGAPGTGKTLLAKAVANESEANFIAIRGPEVLSKWVGESERAIREIFRKAKQAAPCIVFLDEIDSIAPMRGAYEGGSHVTETVVNQLLSSVDGIENMAGVVVIAATNRPDMIDPALIRAGRFDRLILVPGPEEPARLEILKIHTRNMRLADDVNLPQLAKRMEGYVGADIENVCREAVMIGLRKNMETDSITVQDFEDALETVHPSITPQTSDFYKQLEKKLLGRVVKSDERREPGLYA